MSAVDEWRGKLVAMLAGEENGAGRSLLDFLGAEDERQEEEDDNDEQAKRLKKNRDDRINVARQLGDLRKLAGQRKQKRQEALRDIVKLEKKKIYESIALQMLAREETEKKLEEVELQQKEAMVRLQELEKARQRNRTLNQETTNAMIDKTEENLQPVLERLKDASDDVDAIMSKHRQVFSDDHEVTAIMSNELYHSLRKLHMKKEADISAKRQELLKERFEIEERLMKLHESKGNTYNSA